VSVTIEDIYNNKKYGTPLPEKSFYVTFDDGYLSNYQYAFPILCELKIHASIFLVEDYEKLDNFFSYEQAREMEQSGYITVYSHSKDHIYHTSVPKNEAITAVSKAIRNIEEKVSNHDIITFAWPYNSYNSALAIDLGNTGVKLQFVQSIIPTKMTDSFLVLRKSVGLDDVAIDIADSFYK